MTTTPTPGPCGCEVKLPDHYGYSAPIITYCPLHAAAPEMRAQLQRIVDRPAADCMAFWDSDVRALLARIEDK